MTTTMTPCIITVAITGSVPTKKDNPAVPVTVAEQVESTHASFEAGATLAHIHVRKDDGSVSSDPDRFALAVANQILGAGMSSRLFQAIREERGLAYSVYSYTAGYADTGALVVYAGTSPARLETVEALVDEEIARFLADGPTEAELRVARGYLTGSTVLSLEDSGGCMSRIGKAILNYGAVMPLDDLLERYRAVTLDDVRRATERVLGGDRSVAVVGPRTRRPPRTRREAVPSRQGSGA